MIENIFFFLFTHKKVDDVASPKVQAVISYFGPMSLLNLTIEKPRNAWIVEDLLGGTLEGDRLRLAEMGIFFIFFFHFFFHRYFTDISPIFHPRPQNVVF